MDAYPEAWDAQQRTDRRYRFNGVAGGAGMARACGHLNAHLASRFGPTAHSHFLGRRLWQNDNHAGSDVTTPPIIFGPVLRTASSNRAARGFNGKTMHSLSALTPLQSLRTSKLGSMSHTQRKKLSAVQGCAGAWLMDEVLQTQAQLFHAGALRTTYARASRYHLHMAEYARPRHIFGRISFLALCGDHLQLPPVPRSTSLLAPLDGTSDEQKAGAAMFANIDYCYEMQTMMRFRDPILRSILTKMRQPEGRELSHDEWDALSKTELDTVELQRDPAAFLARTEGWIESCYLWSVTSMVVFSRAKASAMQHQKLLYYCLAVDSSDQLSKADLHKYCERMLQVPGLSDTGKLPGIVPIHIGMRMRMTKASEALRPFALPDATGTITSIDLHDEDRARVAELHQRSDAPQLAAHAIVLRHLPLVWLKLDEATMHFLPAEVCPMHQAVGFVQTCPHCVSLPGIIELSPSASVWHYKDVADGVAITVTRTQLPLLPESACSLYSLQGATADPGMIAHFAMPRRADSALQWLIVYVLLSRVRGLDSLISVGMTKKIRATIEAGAPAEVIANFERLFREKITNTTRIAKESRTALRWPAHA